MVTKPLSTKRNIKWLWMSVANSVEHDISSNDVCFGSTVKFVNAMLVSRKTRSVCIVALSIYNDYLH